MLLALVQLLLLLPASIAFPVPAISIPILFKFKLNRHWQMCDNSVES